MYPFLIALYDQFKAPCQKFLVSPNFAFSEVFLVKKTDKLPDVSPLAYGVEKRPNQACAYHGHAYLLAKVGFILRMFKNRLCPTEGVRIGQKGPFESSLFFDIRQITLNIFHKLL